MNDQTQSRENMNATLIKGENTSFSAADLTIRDRVLGLSEALSQTTPIDKGRKDALLAQLSREVENLQSQLRNTEEMFGAGDEMVSVLREALASAESRRDTRLIELDIDEEEGKAGDTGSRGAKLSAMNADDYNSEEPDKDKTAFALLLLAWFMLNRQSHYNAPQHYAMAL